MTQKRDYIVVGDGWLLGHLRKDGERIALTERQVKYVSERVKLADAPKPAAAAAPAASVPSRALPKSAPEPEAL